MKAMEMIVGGFRKMACGYRRCPCNVLSAERCLPLQEMAEIYRRLYSSIIALEKH